MMLTDTWEIVVLQAFGRYRLGLNIRCLTGLILGMIYSVI